MMQMLRENATRVVNLQCVSTAHSLVDNMYHNLQCGYESLTWFALRGKGTSLKRLNACLHVEVTFSAMTVLLAASVLPDLHVDLEQHPGRTSWTRALRVFELYKLQDKSADSGIQALWDLRRRYQAIKNQGL